MGWQSQRAGKRVLACLAVLGAGGIAGLLAGFSAEPAQTSEQTSEPSPAEVVALRFPGGASPIASSRVAAAPAATGYTLASVEPDAQVSSLLFSPFPTYSPPAASASPASSPPQSSAPAASRASLPPLLVTASVEIPATAMAYAAPEAVERAEPAMPAVRPEIASAAPALAKRPIQPPHPASPSAASQGPASPSNAVLNNAQIASIRERLKLSSYQNQLWPPVESALRDISYQGHAKLASNGPASAPASAHGGTIDPNSASVQRLKSAAFPLLMSLSEEQKQEIRVMVRLMGLENLASQF